MNLFFKLTHFSYGNTLINPYSCKKKSLHVDFFVLLRLFFKHIIKLTIKVSETIQNFLTNFKKDSSKEVG